MQQLEAVETIEGPVMVLAGPGTGKTQVVAMRIAEILTRTQIAPRNILALTFTDSGVATLRTRLETIIGPDAYQVTIATFHGFSNEIISTFPYLFNLDENFQRLTDLERYLLLEDIVLESPDISLLRPPKVPTAHVGAISASIKTVKQEGVTPLKLKELAEDQIKQAKSSKESKVIRERNLLFARKNLELSLIYEVYESRLRERQLYDYEDMILRAVQELKSNDELRLHYQERYQYILVDEYQDTNNAQNELVETLSSFFKNPNLFVVGDDKQAIYRFQGASVANMLHFIKKYPDIKTISLRDNYRSTPEILSTAQSLIDHNSHQLPNFIKGIETNLQSVKSSGRKPLFIELPTTYSQYDWIIDEIKRLVKEEAVSLSEIAVLFRLNAEVREFRRLAEKHHLAVSGVLQSNLIKENEIQLLVTVLQAIEQPTNNNVVFPAMRALVEQDDLVDLLEAINSKAGTKQPVIFRFLKHEKGSINLSANLLLELHKKMDRISLVELFEEVIAGSNILEATRKRPDRLEGLELLSAFLDEVRRFSMRRSTIKLRDFLSHLDLLKKYNIQLNVNRVLPEKNGLFVATIHAAKGQEFEAVFMPNVDEVCWNTRQTRSAIKLPGTIVKMKGWNDDTVEDDRRVFYVGLTRAKKLLYFVRSSSDDDGRLVAPCQFISELGSSVIKEELALSERHVEKMYLAHLRPMPLSKMAERELAYVRERVSANPFSFTDLKTYQLCPKQYLLSRVFKLPSEPTIPLVYGNAVHRALELFFRQYRATKHLPGVKYLLESFDKALREQPSVKQDQHILAQGRMVLEAYYERLSSGWSVPVGVEYSFRAHHVMLDDIWITGKFDRLDVLDVQTRSVRVVDYKTASSAKSRKEIEGDTKNSDGSLKKQLTFYALLASQDRLFPYNAKEFQLSFIDDKQTFKQESFEIGRDEIDQLGKEIIKTYHEILQRKHFNHTREDFDKGCEICSAFPSP